MTNMTIDLTQIILAIITVTGGLIARYVIPWLKNKLDDRQYNVLAALVRVGVFAAEQIFTSEQWKEKKQYVVDLLKENGYEVDTTAVDALIESTVRELRIEQGDNRDSATAKLIVSKQSEEAKETEETTEEEADET